MIVDESIYGRNREYMVKEESQYYEFNEGQFDEDNNGFDVDNHKKNPDFTLLSDSKIMRGEGRALVCAVGDMTYLSRIRTKESLIINEQKTNLEFKLERISEIVGKWAYMFTIIIGLTLLVYNTLHMLFRGDKSLFSNDTLLDTIRILILSLCLLIVAIPEGMPLAISIAMAMSVDSMKKDKILIKNIDRVQTCALLHDICVGKTGTLTEGNMHVGSYQMIGLPEVHPNNWHDSVGRAYFSNQMKIKNQIDPNANAEIKSFVIESILANSDVRIEVDEGDN